MNSKKPKETDTQRLSTAITEKMAVIKKKGKNGCAKKKSSVLKKLRDLKDKKEEES